MRPLVILVALLAAGCSSGAVLEPAGSPRGTNLGEDTPFLYDTSPAAFREVRTLVVDPDDGPPMICTGDVAASLPPICGGVELANWDWDRVDDEHHSAGTRWGDFHFVGLVDGGRFYVTGFVE